MAERKHPLDRLLAKGEKDDFSNGYETSLKILARQVAQGAERKVTEAFFREFLLRRLRTNQYAYILAVDPKGRPKPQTTFYDTLQNAGVLNKLLLRSNLTELRKWMLLKVVFRVEQANRMKRRSPQGFALKFHRAFLTELFRHTNDVEKIAQKNNATRAVTSYQHLVGKELRQQVQILIAFLRPQSWKMLLQGQGKNEPEHEDDALKLQIYAFLKAKLQTTKSQPLGISNSFLRQLTLVVWSPPKTENAMLDGSAALYQHIKQRYKSR